MSDYYDNRAAEENDERAEAEDYDRIRGGESKVSRQEARRRYNEYVAKKARGGYINARGEVCYKDDQNGLAGR